MNHSAAPSKFELFVSNPQRLTAIGLVLAVLGTWLALTIHTGAYWFYQVAFVVLILTGMMLLMKPVWFVNFLLILLVADVTGYIRDAVQVPGLMGLVDTGGKFKVPEILSLFAIFHLVIRFFMAPQEFRQPLSGHLALFCLGGLIATMIGVRRYVPTQALRDSLAYYFSLFYVLGMVLLPSLSAARNTFRAFFYAACIAVTYCYAYSVWSKSTAAFYSSISSMFFSMCAYFLIAKFFTTPQGGRRWLTLVMIMVFAAGIFVGRTRSGVLFFLAGLVPLWVALRAHQKVQVLIGLVAPCLLLMIALFAIEANRPTYGYDPYNPGARGIEAFTKMGSEEFDGTGSARLEMWGKAFRGFLESPIVGKGYGWTINVAGTDSPAAIIHNSFLHVLACSGLMGFIPLMTFVLGFFAICRWKMTQNVSFQKQVFTGLAFSIGLNFFLTAVPNVILETASSAIVGWLLVAIAMRAALASPEELAAVIPYRRSAYS